MIAKTSRRNIVTLFATSLLFGVGAVNAQGQAPAQPPKPAVKSGAAGQGASKKGASSPRADDRALLHPALLKTKAPEQDQGEIVVTPGELQPTATRARA